MEKKVLSESYLMKSTIFLDTRVISLYQSNHKETNRDEISCLTIYAGKKENLVLK